jgi:hypothetical protein
LTMTREDGSASRSIVGIARGNGEEEKSSFIGICLGPSDVPLRPARPD